MIGVVTDVDATQSAQIAHLYQRDQDQETEIRDNEALDSERISALEARASTLESRVTAGTTDDRALATRVTALEAVPTVDVTALTNRITNLEATVANHENRIKILESSLVNIHL